MIPIRDSYLTMMLKDELGGNSVVYAICTISPSSNQLA